VIGHRVISHGVVSGRVLGRRAVSGRVVEGLTQALVHVVEDLDVLVDRALAQVVGASDGLIHPWVAERVRGHLLILGLGLVAPARVIIVMLHRFVSFVLAPSCCRGPR